MKNSQVAVLCATIVAGSLIVAGTNVWLVRSLAAGGESRDRSRNGRAHAGIAAVRRPVIAMMPKAKGDPYFISCRAGAEEAAQELGVELIWDGPTGLDAARQNELVENWITRRRRRDCGGGREPRRHLDAFCARPASAASRC